MSEISKKKDTEKHRFEKKFTDHKDTKKADSSYAKPYHKTDDQRKASYGKPVNAASSGERKPFRSNEHTAGSKSAFEKSAYYHKPSQYARPEAVSVSPARRIAYTVLCEVYEKGAYASLSLNRHLQDTEMKEEDRRLATALVYGVIEKEGYLDYLIDQFLRAPLDDDHQRTILRMGVYQLLFMDRVPDSAAVNESVNLCKIVGMPASAGFINAILRSLLRGKETLKQPNREADPEGYLSVMSSTPRWLVRRLVLDYGEEEAEKLLLSGEESRGIIIRPNFTVMSDAELEKKLDEKKWRWDKGIVPHAYRVNGVDAARSKEFAAGQLSIQGQSSMLSAMAMDAKPGMKLLDACAAPGGKSAYLCEVMQLSGRVYSWELHETRVALLEGTKKRLHLDNMRPAQHDALQIREEWIGTLDGVLLDAPCSGTGVMAQKPDIKHHLQESAISEIVDTQRRLLDTVCQYVKRGGTLVYSTCSVLKDENEHQIKRFLCDHPEFSIDRLPDSFPACIAEKQTADGLQLLSGEFGLEGFFIARMRRMR